MLAAGGAEVYLRLTDPGPGPFGPFTEDVLPVRLVPGVGITRPPHAEIRYTRNREFWQISRANSLGFVDREPPAPARAAESCHVTLIGDSFVEALEVPVADKVQVRLEELASRELPALDVTTSAFGHRSTAQINQLAFYDAFARRLSPDVVVLVAVRNDFVGNSLPIRVWSRAFHPEYPPWFYARPGTGGELEFVPPASTLEELEANSLSRLLAEPALPSPWWRGAEQASRALRERSHLVDWFWQTLENRASEARREAARLARAEWLSRQPRYATFMRGWPATKYQHDLLLEENPPPAYREALDVTRFALEQFRERTERDGTTLVILAIYDLGRPGDPWFDLLHDIAGNTGEGIPIINQYEHITARGGDVSDARWEHDYHWTPTGHRWAAEAIWEWLKRNPEVCD